MAPISRRSRPTHLSRLTAYAEQNDDDLLIPEDLTVLSDEELSTLQTSAAEAFDALYGDGSTLSDEDVTALAALTEGIEALAAEAERRAEAATARSDAAAALAARVHPAETPADGPEEEEEEENPDIIESADQTPAETPDTPADTPAAIAASGRRTGPINIPAARARAPRQPQPAAAPAPSMRDVAYATSDLLGLAANTPVDWADSGRMLDRRITGFPLGQYQAAQTRGQHIREQHSLMAFRRDIPADLVVASASPEAMENAMNRAVDQSRLPGGALTAAGWCAPSEPLYDLCYNESRDGLLSLPEVGINRGGILVPTAPSFADLYANIGFSFTEEQAIAGEWAPGPGGSPNVVGDKPCYEVECPEWEDVRLQGDGLCIVANLLAYRGYPEALARVTSGALVAHDHRISANRIAKIIAGSTAVTMTTDSVGTTAPLLAAIELQVEHYRYTQRLARTTILEAILPFWVRGAIRQDLSARLGVDLLAVTDAQIDAWFRLRGIAPQYVYDWQAIDANSAEDAIQWPETVQFILYVAGTWVAGVDDIITLDTLYDSTLLGQNKFTALFTEEAWLIAKRCEDSRVVTVPVCSDGSTHAGVLLDCNLGPTVEAQ